MKADIEMPRDINEIINKVSKWADKKHIDDFIADEIEWRKWLDNEGLIFQRCTVFPRTILMDKHHFGMFVYEDDMFEHEPFEIDWLSDYEALQMLLAIEDYCEKFYPERFLNWFWCALRERFNLPGYYDLALNDAFDNNDWSKIPESLVNEIILTYIFPWYNMKLLSLSEGKCSNVDV